jgi:hypothetical protein
MWQRDPDCDEMALDLLDPPKLHRAWHTPCFDNLNNLEWPYGFAATCFGVRIGVRANNPDLLDRLRRLLPVDAKPYPGEVVDHYFSAVLGGSVAGSRVRKFHLLYGNHTLLLRGREIDAITDAFEPAFRQVVASLAPRRIFVHAGVVGWKGRAILFPGKTLSGKTTMVAELVRAGASYFSDECRAGYGRSGAPVPQTAVSARQPHRQASGDAGRNAGREIGAAPVTRRPCCDEYLQGWRALAAQNTHSRPRRTGHAHAYDYRRACT